MNKYATTINNNVYSSKDGSPKTNSLKNELLVRISESFIELWNLIYQIIRISQTTLEAYFILLPLVFQSLYALFYFIKNFSS